MTRLTTTIRWDIQLQFRNGFYYASAFVVIISTIILRQFPNADFGYLLPMILFENLLINTFYFISGLVLLEKGENTLEGLIVSPLRKWEYLLSKIITLALLSILESIILTMVVFGIGLNWPIFLIGLLITCVLYALFGFIFVVRYDSINSFLFPSVLITTLLSLPLLDYLALWESPVMAIHPLQGGMLLLKGGFQTISTGELIYSLLYSALWIGITFVLSHRAFYRFVILKQGVR